MNKKHLKQESRRTSLKNLAWLVIVLMVMACGDSALVGEAEEIDHIGALETDDGSPLSESASLSVGAITAGYYHTCGIRTSREVACWGRNDDGQASPPSGTFIDIAAGRSHSCGIRTDQTVVCWGENDDGQASPPAGEFAAISAYGSYSCGVRTDSTALCWGSESLELGSGFLDIAAGDGNVCGVLTNRAVVCKGQNVGTNSGSLSFPAGEFTVIDTIGQRWCGIRTDQTVACWGINQPVEDSTTKATDLAVGRRHICTISLDETVGCGGKNDDGQASPPSGTFIDLAAGWYYSCGIRTDQTVACWGENDYGQASPPSGTFG